MDRFARLRRKPPKSPKAAADADAETNTAADPAANNPTDASDNHFSPSSRKHHQYHHHHHMASLFHQRRNQTQTQAAEPHQQTQSRDHIPTQESQRQDRQAHTSSTTQAQAQAYEPQQQDQQNEDIASDRHKPLGSYFNILKRHGLGHGQPRHVVKLDQQSSPPSSPLETNSIMSGKQDTRSVARPSSSLMTPKFLSQSRQEIDNKYNELTWTERDRVAEGVRNQSVQDFRWGTHVHPDTQLAGTVDRYSNVKPWNHNRVKLDVPEDTSDYVNASLINLHPTPASDGTSLPPLRYIAMQGPTEHSTAAVWRMIAEQTDSPVVIVQLTGLTEAGTVKCHQYFPSSDSAEPWTLNEDDTWGDGWLASVTPVSLDFLADGAIERRKFHLQVESNPNGRPLTIWHYWYHRWSDFGVPSGVDLGSFFQLMDLSREHCSPSTIRIIHCSAGIGRTGTFIALEHLIREFELGSFENSNEESGEDADPVFQTVDSLRAQRKGMVQGEIQYRFIYRVLRQRWEAKYGAIDGEEL